jgi:hypothetical protein
MNAYKIEINSEINDIFTGDLLKAIKKMKNKLLKIRNEITRKNQDMGQLVENRKLTKENWFNILKAINYAN